MASTKAATIIGLVALSGLRYADAASCPASKPVPGVSSNNPKFDGSCQVYKRGQVPCMTDSTALGEWAGWFTVFFMGGVFALMAIVLFLHQCNKLGMTMSSELFNCGGRNVGPGLTASAIVSKWTWAATLLMSTHMGWQFGISGPFWYASGATIQILLFAFLAARIKQRASHMHTFLEVVKVRFGTVTHCIMMSFAVATNIIVSSMLLLGGASTLQALTGMSQIMACILIPLVSCWGYAVYGGLRASFLASFIHTTLIMFMLIIWAFAVFAGSDDDGLVGSPGDVHKAVTMASVHGFFNATRSELEIRSGYFARANHDTFFSGLGGILQNNGECFDQKGVKTGKTCGFTEQGKNKPCCAKLDWAKEAPPGGSYCRSDTADCISVSAEKHFLSKECNFEEGEKCVTSFITMGSTLGLIFGITNIVGNFGTVFVDQSYWQSAIASKRGIAGVVGFGFGGMVWFAVPFVMGTTLAFGGRALTTAPMLKGAYGSRYIDAGISGNGLTPAFVVDHLLGGFGAFLLLIQLFAAICSTGSAEILAVSSILTYDVYYEYVHPELKMKRKQKQAMYDAAQKKALARTEGNSKTTDSDAKVKLTNVQAVLDELAGMKFWGDGGMNKDELTKVGTHLSAISSDGQVDSQELKDALMVSQEEGALLLQVSRFFTGVYALFMGFLAMLLLALGIPLGHVYMSMGCLVGCAVGPAAISISMETANGKAVGAGAVGGFLIAMLAWVLQAFNEFGTVQYETVMSDWPWVMGNLGGILGGLGITFIGSLIWPNTDFRWEMLNQEIPMVDDVEPPVDDEVFTDPDFLNNVAKIAAGASGAMTFLMIFLWPAPMHLLSGVFSDAGFTIWISLMFIWLLIGGVSIVVLPVYELITSSNQYKDQADMAKLKPGMAHKAVEEGNGDNDDKEDNQKAAKEMKTLKSRVAELEAGKKESAAEAAKNAELQKKIAALEKENEALLADKNKAASKPKAAPKKAAPKAKPEATV